MDSVTSGIPINTYLRAYLLAIILLGVTSTLLVAQMSSTSYTTSQRPQIIPKIIIEAEEPPDGYFETFLMTPDDLGHGAAAFRQCQVDTGGMSMLDWTWFIVLFQKFIVCNGEGVFSLGYAYSKDTLAFARVVHSDTEKR